MWDLEKIKASHILHHDPRKLPARPSYKADLLNLFLVVELGDHHATVLDGDRFEGRFRDGVHASNVSDLMRRMVKEDLLKFDAKPLFPERFAHTVPYKLSDPEALLYKEVTEYVREEFNRAEALQNDKRAGTVGFALTILQRRLASSPEAIFHSLRRRRERLESRMRELVLLQRGGTLPETAVPSVPALEANPTELLQVILNLITNGADASPEGGRVEVRTRKERGAAVLEVCDSGPGIPAALRERIVAEARELLATLGVEVNNPRVLALLADHGAGQNAGAGMHGDAAAKLHVVANRGPGVHVDLRTDSGSRADMSCRANARCRRGARRPETGHHALVRADVGDLPRFSRSSRGRAGCSTRVPRDPRPPPERTPLERRRARGTRDRPGHPPPPAPTR